MIIYFIIGILSTTIFDAANLIFLAYLFLMNGLTGAVALVGKCFTPKIKSWELPF